MAPKRRARRLRIYASRQTCLIDFYARRCSLLGAAALPRLGRRKEIYEALPSRVDIYTFLHML